MTDCQDAKHHARSGEINFGQNGLWPLLFTTLACTKVGFATFGLHQVWHHHLACTKFGQTLALWYFGTVAKPTLATHLLSILPMNLGFLCWGLRRVDENNVFARRGQVGRRGSEGVRPEGRWPRRAGPGGVGAPNLEMSGPDGWGAQNVALLFFPGQHITFCLLSGGLLVQFLVVMFLTSMQRISI